MSDTRWLLLLCASRLGFSLINTVYAALIPVLRPAWSMSASQAGALLGPWATWRLQQLRRSSAQ